MRSADLDALPRLYRSDAVRAIERIAMDRYDLDEDDLMARAGLAAWRLLLDRWPDAQRIGIVCGPGNNGGDGYVLAELARSSGRQVQVLRLGDAVKPGPAARAAEAFRQAGGAIATYRSGDAWPYADVWVDALFGIGLQRALDGVAADCVRALNRDNASPVLALDVPSGVDADTGHHDGAVRATATLSFICGKPGLYTGRGRTAAGEVAIDRLGLHDEVYDDLQPAARVANADALAQWFRPRARDAHKGRYGRVLCVGGEHGYGGALALCAEAAHRAGAGLVSAATRAEHVQTLLTRRPECMARAVDDGDALRPLLDEASVVAVGPGLGRGAWGAGLLDAALASAKPAVIDADALNLLAPRAPRALGDATLTPHPGEAARLLGVDVGEIERDRFRAAQSLAARYGCVVVLKGAGTVVAAPNEIPVVIDAGNPGMASGGMGDALTGILAALIAQSAAAPGDAQDAAHRASTHAIAVCGALLHSAAADAAAREGGERGLLASDLFPHVRRLANPVNA
ncbi:MAG: NAD(P)H-hydrate dehydratase [Lysobacter sp.]|nr:MAG: NAD(P)H-hydrate dehydratase [Lysobacter sp.]